MIPVLFPEGATTFTTNGLGRLSDVITCEVNEVLNGMYELALEYTATGQHAEDIAERKIILAKPNDTDNPQPFRIYEVKENARTSRLEVKAQHISYDLNGIPVEPFSATGIVPTLTGLTTHSMTTNPFTFWTDITNTDSMYNQVVPASVRACLGGRRGSVLDTFGGEYKWDGYTVRVYAHRGQDNGVSIRYGKNLSELNNERSNEKFFTGCVAYWEKEDEAITGQVQEIPDAANYPIKKTYILDVSGDYDDMPDVSTLNEAAQLYITNNNLGLPFRDTLEVNFVPLWQTAEYKNIAPLERVSMGDTVHVVYKDFNVTMKVVEYYYDVLAERYTDITLGTKKASLKSTITDPIEKEIATTMTQVVSNLETAIDEATNLIRGGLGGYVVINTNANGQPNEILIMDQPSIENAVHVIRMNLNGIGFSSTGYAGDFTNAWTIDGHLNADFIDTGELDGNLIRAASVLASALEVNAYEAVTGTIENVTFDGQGMHIARKDPDSGAIVSEYESLFTELGMRVMDSNGNITLSAEQDTVDAVNLSAHQYLRIVDDENATNSRFQGFYNSIHNKVQHGIFWEK